MQPGVGDRVIVECGRTKTVHLLGVPALSNFLRQPAVEILPDVLAFRPNFVNRDWREAPVEEPMEMARVTPSGSVPGPNLWPLEFVGWPDSNL